MAGRTGKDERRTNLIGPLNESDRKLWTERIDGPAPGLTGRGVPETERFEIITGGVQKTLRTLIVDIEIPWTGQRE